MSGYVVCYWVVVWCIGILVRDNWKGFYEVFLWLVLVCLGFGVDSVFYFGGYGCLWWFVLVGVVGLVVVVVIGCLVYFFVGL